MPLNKTYDSPYSKVDPLIHNVFEEPIALSIPNRPPKHVLWVGKLVPANQGLDNVFVSYFFKQRSNEYLANLIEHDFFIAPVLMVHLGGVFGSGVTVCIEKDAVGQGPDFEGEILRERKDRYLNAFCGTYCSIGSVPP